MARLECCRETEIAIFAAPTNLPIYDFQIVKSGAWFRLCNIMVVSASFSPPPPPMPKCVYGKDLLIAQLFKLLVSAESTTNDQIVLMVIQTYKYAIDFGGSN